MSASALPAQCSVDGWCWLFPSPQGNTLRAVWSGGGEKWAVGDAGTALHLQGSPDSTWKHVATSTRVNLHAVWGSDSTHVWAVGDAGTILRWDGSAWSQVDFWQNRMDLYAVWGSANNDVWFAGASGVLLHWDGASITQSVTTTPKVLLRGLWGKSATDVYAAGSYSKDPEPVGSATVLHWDGTKWSSFAPPPAATTTKDDFSSIWGHAELGVFVGTMQGAIYMHDGKAWTTARPIPARSDAIEGGWASADKSVFAVGGVQYTDPLRTDPTIRQGTLLKWNGASFVDINAATAPKVGLFGVIADSAGDLTAVGQSGTVVRFDGTGFTSSGAVEPLTGVGATMRGVAGAPEAELVAVGDFGTSLQYDGSAWKTLPSSVQQSLLAVSGTGPNVLSVSHNLIDGKSLIQRFVAGTWVPETMPAVLVLRSVFSGSDGALAAGGNEVVLVRSGTSWTQRPVQATVRGNVLRGVWMTGTTLWAVGGGDSVESRTDLCPATALVSTGGQDFVRTTLPNSNVILYGVWGTSPSNVFAVGAQGSLLRWNGTAWQQQSAIPFGGTLRGIFGRSANDIYAAGDSGAILHFDGTAWTREDSGTNVTLHSVFVSGKSVYATGDNGSILRKLTP